MFGVHCLYIGEKAFLATRKREKAPEDNGIWIGTSAEHLPSLQAQFPDLRPLVSHPIKKWILIPEDSDTFEETATSVCELIKAGDPRIGVLPKSKKKKRG